MKKYWMGFQSKLIDIGDFGVDAIQVFPHASLSRRQLMGVSFSSNFLSSFSSIMFEIACSNSS